MSSGHAATVRSHPPAAPIEPPLAPPSASRKREVLVYAVPTILAGLLCSYGLTSRSLGFDEAASVTIAAQHGSALGAAFAHDGGNMSGYYLLLHVLTGLFGNGLLVVRMPSVLCAAATAGVAARLARTLFDSRVGLISGSLVAVSLPLVFWGQSARGYAPMVALTATSYLAFVSLVRRREQERPALGPAIVYALATSLAVYASFVAVLVIPAQLLMLLHRRRARAPVLSALGVCVLSWIPLFVLALSRGSGQLFWVPRPTLKVEKQVLESLSAAGLEPSFHATATTVLLLVLTAVTLLGVAALVMLRSARGERLWGHWLALGWLAVPVALAWLESLVGQPIFLPRNVLMASVPVAILVALAVTDRRLPVLAGGALLVVLIGLRAVQVGASYGVSPEDWKGATAYVLARSSSSDCAVFYPSDGRMAFRYYLSEPAPRAAPLPILPAAPWTRAPTYVEDYASLNASQLSSVPARCPRLWLISSHEGQAKGPSGARANYARYLRLRAQLAREYPRRVTAKFGYASPVHIELFAPGSGS
ncbi:MAG: glycosyltransferase family 39 protein [Actinomycetota bacterium]|nr:glycosyltransferase family 39 protein [Actinomycetota bacterium]